MSFLCQYRFGGASVLNRKVCGPKNLFQCLDAVSVENLYGRRELVFMAPITGKQVLIDQSDGVIRGDSQPQIVVFTCWKAFIKSFFSFE